MTERHESAPSTGPSKSGAKKCHPWKKIRKNRTTDRSRTGAKTSPHWGSSLRPGSNRCIINPPSTWRPFPWGRPCRRRSRLTPAPRLNPAHPTGPRPRQRRYLSRNSSLHSCRRVRPPSPDWGQARVLASCWFPVPGSPPTARAEIQSPRPTRTFVPLSLGCGPEAAMGRPAPSSVFGSAVRPACYTLSLHGLPGKVTAASANCLRPPSAGPGPGRPPTNPVRDLGGWPPASGPLPAHRLPVAPPDRDTGLPGR